MPPSFFPELFISNVHFQAGRGEVVGRALREGHYWCANITVCCRIKKMEGRIPRRRFKHDLLTLNEWRGGA